MKEVLDESSFVLGSLLFRMDVELTVELGEAGVVLPHPRMHCRAFVLKPLADMAPDWRHPTLGQSAVELLEALSGDGRIIPL